MLACQLRLGPKVKLAGRSLQLYCFLFYFLLLELNNVVDSKMHLRQNSAALCSVIIKRWTVAVTFHRSTPLSFVDYKWIEFGVMFYHSKEEKRKHIPSQVAVVFLHLWDSVALSIVERRQSPWEISESGLDCWPNYSSILSFQTALLIYIQIILRSISFVEVLLFNGCFK